MDADDKEVLRRIADGVEKLVGAIPKQESKAMRIFGAIATVAGAMGLLGIIQVIIEWIWG